MSKELKKRACVKVNKFYSTASLGFFGLTTTKESST